MARDEAERKFEKFKAHFIAQQALMNNQVRVTMQLSYAYSLSYYTSSVPSRTLRNRPKNCSHEIGAIITYIDMQSNFAPPENRQCHALLLF